MQIYVEQARELPRGMERRTATAMATVTATRTATAIRTETKNISAQYQVRVLMASN